MANDEVLGPRKTMLVLVIVVGCFAVLWPRILSPLIVGHTQEQIKPNKFDREAGCCEVIFQSEVAVLELVNEVCNSALGVDKLSPQSAIQCRKAVNETCGLDIAAFLKKNENVGKTTKMLVEAMKNMNSSCLRENFGVPIYSLSVHSPINSWKLQESLKQERPVRGGGPHPALRERGRAIPPGVPGVPPPGRQQMPPHVRVRSPLSVYFELEPPPIPGMRPPLGSPGGPVTAPKSSMGFVMPIYTICIIVFFVYTLSKILFKRTGAPYEPITPDPQFRRRVFRDESRTSPDKLVVSAISGLVAEVEQQMEASQQRQESQDNQTRPYTNGTILLNTGPVQIVTSEYQEKEQTPDLAKSKQNLLERKDSSPESKHSLHDTQERTLLNDLKPIQEEAILTKDITEFKEQSSQHETNSIKNLSQPNVPSSFKTSIDENETSTERREFSHDTEGSFIEQYEPSHEVEYANKDNDLSPEPIEPIPQPKDSFIEQEDQEQHKSYLEQNDILLDPEEVSIDPKLSATEPKQTSQDPIENSILPDEPPPESKDMSIELKESSPDLKDTSIQKNSSLYPDTAPEPKESSIENQSYSDSKESSQLIEEKYEYVERELFPEPKESSLEKELKELYESSSEEEFIPDLLEDKVETEVSLSPEPEACITPDHEFPIKCDDKHSNTDNSSIPSKEATFGEDSIIIDTKELTPESNKSLSGSNKPAAETDNEKLSEGIDETSVKEEFNIDKETLVLDSKVLDNSDKKQDTIAKSTEEFLQEEREVATKDGPSTPELLAEALKEDTSKDEIELDNESSTVKVVGMEVTAHPADGSVWPGARPPLAPPKPPSQQHKAEDVKSIFLETEIPQQSRVLVADFEDNADKQKPAKNAPLVVSGKMTLSLIQDAPRDTPERDLESTVDEFTTASATTQPPAEREDSSDEDLDEEIEVEEIEEDLELESDEEVEPRAVSKSERK